MTCPNCNTTLSCGCKKRTASDGTQVCTTCLASYEQSLKNKATKQTALSEAQAIIYNNND